MLTNLTTLGKTDKQHNLPKLTQEENSLNRPVSIIGTESFINNQTQGGELADSTKKLFKKEILFQFPITTFRRQKQRDYLLICSIRPALPKPDNDITRKESYRRWAFGMVVKALFGIPTSHSGMPGFNSRLWLLTL